MLKIGICDMDAEFVQNFHKMLEEILDQYTEWESLVYDDSSEIIAEIEAGVFSCQLLFLDIFQKQGNGIAIAELVRQYHMDTDIIFITASQDYVFQCYQSHTFAYLLKPLKTQDISLEVNRYLKERKMNPKCLNISNHGLVTKIPLENIMYIESAHRKIVVHTKQRNYEYYEKLNHLEELLKEDGFLRCHQSYLVAANKITTYQGHTLQVGYDAIPVSRRYQNVIIRQMEAMEIAVSREHILVRDNLDMVSPPQLSKQADHMFLTSGVFQFNDMKGALICVKGAYIGKIVRIVPEQIIMVGRDYKQADMVVNLPLVSRQHCTIVYHQSSNDYEIIDQSSNGTFVDGSYRLTRGDVYRLKPGANISFGDKNLVYRLG